MTGSGHQDVNMALRWTQRLARGAAILALLAAATLVTVLVMPLAGATSHSGPSGRLAIKPVEATDYRVLATRLAGATFIRPAQIKAAVRDSGAAQKLLKRLKLQGIVEAGEGRIAYIAIEGMGVQTVRSGEQVLDFTIQDIKANSIVLTLEGVQVELRY